MSDELLDIQTLPCGCVLTRKIENGVKTFQIAPCRMDCVNLANVLALADEASKPVRRLPGVRRGRLSEC